VRAYFSNYLNPVGRALARSGCQIGRALATIARQVNDECHRLNHSGDHRLMTGTRCRRLESRAFRASLAQRYGDFRRCC
jgi:hypothetical protein